MSKIMGIDPGKTGALAILVDKNYSFVYDIPTDTSNEYDLDKLWSIIERENPDFVAIEDKAMIIGKTSHRTSRSLGWISGAIEAILSKLDIGWLSIPPKSWKTYYELTIPRNVKKGMTSGEVKQLSIDKAIELYPAAKKMLTLKKHDGRAEALLIARYFIKTNKLKE